MSLRFFQRLRVMRGVTLNLSKSGVSTSFGPRGAKYTVGHGKRRTTFGLPGTGLFYTTVRNARAKRQEQEQDDASPSPTPREPANNEGGMAIASLALIAVLAGLAAINAPSWWYILALALFGLLAYKAGR